MFDKRRTQISHNRPCGQTQLCDRLGGGGAKVVDKETNRCARWIKEAILVRKTKPTMNRDKSHVGQSARHAI